MYSENFMRYLIAYQNEDLKPSESELKKEKRPLMIDLTGVKYASVPIRNRAK